MMPKTSIIILNWNGFKDTINCIESLRMINYPHYTIIVVDNDSTDNSIKKIKYYCENQIRLFEYTEEELKDFKRKNELNEIRNIKSNNKLILIKNNENYGFAKGNNIGINFSAQNLDHEYILLLNNDTFVDKDFLNELISASENDELIAIVGPLVCPISNGLKYEGIIGSKVLFNRGGIPKGIKSNKFNQEVDMISGSCMLIKNKTIDRIGVLDSTYFFGWEDADYCTKARKIGYKIIGVPKAKVFHKIGSSYGNNSSNNPKILIEGIRNQLIFLWRYASLFQKLTSIIFLPFYYLFLIFWKAKSFNIIKMRSISIIKGILLFISYKYIEGN